MKKHVEKVWRTSIDKTNSSFTHDVNRLKEYADRLTISNKLRKILIQNYNNFVQKLLVEGRITKEELIPYFKKKEDNFRIIKTEEAVHKKFTKIDPLFIKTQNEIMDKEKNGFDEKCHHEIFNQHLIESGQCKTLEEASHIPRYLVCRCKKCNPFTL